MTLDKMLYGALLSALLLPACVVAPGHHGREVAPALPVVVELHLEPYYFHRGFYYYFHDDHHWSYSRSRGDPGQRCRASTIRKKSGSRTGATGAGIAAGTTIATGTTDDKSGVRTARLR